MLRSLIILHSIALRGKADLPEVLDIGGAGDFRQALKSVSSWHEGQLRRSLPLMLSHHPLGAKDVPISLDELLLKLVSWLRLDSNQ